ncbi:MAG: hypothetical protein M1821_004332 [Bathelium mastoideum]|nr:MAG: hypothetical protein M1821_004332 [Bathelium mastoideum]KAI9684002.1 MAG: hypothetical protein M1822_005829 [Bathelium mastoideum]
MEASDEDEPQLPADTLAALREFNEEKHLRAKQFADLQNQAENDFTMKPISMDAFVEDWNASQFWVAIEPSQKPRVILFEYDERFAVFKQDYVHYDFQKPLELQGELNGTFDRLICDPPFLSEDCQTKAALTVKWLSRSWTPHIEGDEKQERPKIIVCTGERMQPVIEKLYGKMGVRTTNLEIQHANGLSNEFRCYANFESDGWKWR